MEEVDKYIRGLLDEALTQNKVDERFHEDHLRALLRESYKTGYSQAIKDENNERRG